MLSFWERYSYGGFGIKWKNTQDMRELYKRTAYLSRFPTPEDYGSNALLQSSWSRRRDYYDVYVFDESDELDRDKISILLGTMATAVEAYREKGYGEAVPYFGHIITSTEDWSPKAWWEVRGTKRQDIRIQTDVLCGSSLLIKLLNEGIIGFAFADIDYYGNIQRTTNQIKLVGPGIPAIRLKEGKLVAELAS